MLHASIKVLIATGIYPPDIGGPATYAVQLFEHLPKRGIEVEVATYANQKSGSRDKNKLFGLTHSLSSGFAQQNRDFAAAIRRSASDRGKGQESGVLTISRELPKGLRHVVYFWKVFWRGRKADIIYALDTVSAGLPAALAARMLRKPFLVKVVGDYAWEQEQLKQKVVSSKQEGMDTIEDFQKRRYGFNTEIKRAIQRWVVGSADKVITPSEYLKGVIAGWGIAYEKIAVIPNAVIVPDALPSKEEARAGLGLSGAVLLSVGRLVPWKGFRMLIRAMAEIKKNVPEAQLLIIGSGPEEESLKAYVRARALEGQVKFVGGVSHDILWSYLRASDIFLLNTAYEGFSHQIIEAMAAGVPVLTTAAGGNKGIIEDGVDGFFIPYDDAEAIQQRIRSLLENKKQYTDIQERAEKKAAQFSLERMLGTTTEFFQSLILKS